MKKEHVEVGIAAYRAETANIRSFLKDGKTISQWQDWLWRRVPRLMNKTERIPASAMVLGGGWSDISCRYTDLLTCLCITGSVLRERGAVTTVYKWVGE